MSIVEDKGFFARIEASWRGWRSLRSLRSRALRVVREQKSLEEETLRSYIEQMRQHPDYLALEGVKRLSMLHVDVLVLLYHLAATSTGTILEIGPYVGGSTISLGMAMKRYARRNKLISVELGGRLDHVDIPSDDIFGDLQKNLRRFGLLDTVDLVKGSSCSPENVEMVKRLVAPGYIDLLFIDADGYVQRDIDTYRSLLRDGALLVLDDYRAPGNPDKAILVKAWVDAAEREGKVKSLGVWGWGTWVGVYLRSAWPSGPIGSDHHAAASL